MEILRVNNVLVDFEQFIVERFVYLCGKLNVIYDDVRASNSLIEKLIDFNHVFNISDNGDVKNAVRKVVLLVNENILGKLGKLKEGESIRFNFLNEYKKIKQLCNEYISDDIELLGKVDKIYNLLKGRVSLLNIQTDDEVVEKKPNVDFELYKDVQKLYYKKIYEIYLQMSNELGKDATDEEKIRWIYDYVLSLEYSFPKEGEYVRTKTGFQYLDCKKITRDGKVYPINSIVYGFPYCGNGSKYNLVFSKERNGTCCAFSRFLEDLCDFSLSRKNYCVSVTGMHCNVPHEWNAIINRQGIFYLDASKDWHGIENQYMININDADKLFSTYKPTWVPVVTENSFPVISVEKVISNSSTIRR